MDAKLLVTLGAFIFAYRSYSAWAARRMTETREASSTLGNLQGGSDTAANSSAKSFPYEPSITDVLVTKAMLTKALSLPPEIVDTVVDLAEYWPHTTTASSFDESVVVARGNSRTREDLFLVSPLCYRDSLKVHRALIPPLFSRFVRLPLDCIAGRVSPTARIICPPRKYRQSRSPRAKNSQPMTSRNRWHCPYHCSPIRAAALSLPSKAMTKAGAARALATAHTTARGHGLRLVWNDGVRPVPFPQVQKSSRYIKNLRNHH